MASKGNNFRFIGQPIPRTEDARLLTGRGQFSDDFSFPGQTYAVLARSPHAHARIVHIDTAAAKKMPGIIGVFTGSDCLADGLDPIPHDPLPKTKYDMKLRGILEEVKSFSGRICFCRPTKHGMSVRRLRWLLLKRRHKPSTPRKQWPSSMSCCLA